MGMWDDDDNGEFRDVPEEAQTKSPNSQALQAQLIPPMEAQPNNAPVQQPAPAPKAGQIPFNGATSRFEQPPSENYVEEIIQDLDAEEDYTEVLNDANLRIEQGRLYQMIMNHDLFDGMDADPRAVANVQREIRKYARERMEIMLGMRQEKSEQTLVSSPFNDLEVSILKMVAAKASGGATERPEANEIAQIVKEPKRQTIKPLTGSTGTKQAPKFTQTKQSAPSPAKQAQTLAKSPVAPVKRQKTDKDLEIDRILAEEGVSREDLELNYTGMGKPFEALSDEEKQKRIEETKQRLASRRTVKSPQALPMATPDQEYMLAAARANQIGQTPGMSALLQKVSSMPVKNP